MNIVLFISAMQDGGAESVAATLGIGTKGALILRPDAVIGWRADEAATDPGAALDAAMRRLLAR